MNGGNATVNNTFSNYEDYYVEHEWEEETHVGLTEIAAFTDLANKWYEWVSIFCHKLIFLE